MSKPLVIWHGGCPDGWTAAWVCTLKLGECDLHAGHYGQPPPDVVGRDVYIVDFSYRRADLERMAGEAAMLRVIDHHKTAKADLEGLPFCTFDMERSGAGLTWDELFAGAGRPWLVDYVEDRDLWRHRLPHSEAVMAYVMAQPYTLDDWGRMSKTSLGTVVELGEAILMKIRAYCQHVGEMARRVQFAGMDVLAVNAPHVMISDLLHHLCEVQQSETLMSMAVALGWWQRGDGQYQYSLRSVGGVDVSELARARGGGGHAAAAGFQSIYPLDRLLEMEWIEAKSSR